jgi:hypothetical protein
LADAGNAPRGSPRHHESAQNYFRPAS